MIRKLEDKDIPHIKAIYEDHQWTSYLTDDTLFETMFKNSLATYVYVDGNTIKGLVRVIGDNAHILYIQDILVSSAYQRQGIGTALMHFLLTTYNHVRQKVLITEKADATANAFYVSLGFKQAEDANITCYVHFS